MPTATPSGRRARLRNQTTAQILTTAREHLAAHGAAGLSLRAIARDLDMGVSSLYRYYPCRDELLTILLVEAFTAQAEAVEAATASAPSGPRERLSAGLHAYRTWSLTHPTEFALAYGAPVPGYQAPGEKTIAAGARVGDLLVAQLTSAWAQGEVDRGVLDRRDATLSEQERLDLGVMIRRRDYDIPTNLMSLAIDMFTRVHGFVVMEVFGQLRPMLSAPEAAFHRLVVQLLREIGLEPGHSGQADPKISPRS